MADIDTKNKLKTFLLRTRRKTEGQGEAVIRFAEDVLPLFVRKYLDADFEDIYSQTRHEVYANWRESVFDISEANKENVAADDQYTETLKLLTDFYDSTTFKGKQKAILTEFEKASKKTAAKKQPKKNIPQPDPLLPEQDGQEELTGERDKARAQPTIATTMPGALRLCMPSLRNGLRVALWGDRQRLHRGSPS